MTLITLIRMYERTTRDGAQMKQVGDDVRCCLIAREKP
jgi:hypothetical protein